MTQHARFRLDAANSPTHNAQTVDHRGVGVGADKRIREHFGTAVHFAGGHYRCQVFQVDLVHNPGCRRNRTEVVKRFLRPTEQAIAFLVPFEFHVHVVFQGILSAVFVHHDGVVDHEIHRDQGIDPRRISTHPFHRGTKRGQVNDGRYAGKVLQHDPGRFEGHFFIRTFFRPPGQLFHMLLSHGFSVTLTDCRFQQHFDGEWQAGNLAQSLFLQPLQAVVCVRFTARFKLGTYTKHVVGHVESLLWMECAKRKSICFI